jgi:AraC-like DNA-binding protein
MIQLFKTLCLFILFISFIGIFKIHAQSKYEDPLIEELNKTYQFQKSIQVAHFKLLKANSNEKKLFYNNCIIRAYTNLSNNDSILISIKNSLDLLPSVHDSELICYTYLRLGLGYKHNLDINNSTKYLLKAADLAKKLNLIYVTVRAYNELGNLIAKENSNFNLALYYLNLSIKYTNAENYDIKSSNNLISKITALENRSAIYLEIGKIKESFDDLFLAKTLLNKLPNNEYYLIYANTRLSANYAEINDKINCEKYINQALKIALSINDLPSIKESYRYLADIAFLFKDYYKAIFYSLKAENYSDKNSENLYSKIYIDSIISLSYQYVGDHENALKYYKSFVELKGKYYEKSKTNELHKLEILYKVEENEKKLALKNLEQTKDKATIQILFLIIFLSVLILIIFIGYKYLENKRKKIIFKNIENYDKEINSIKRWLDWRKNTEKLTQLNLIDQADTIEYNFNSTPENLVNQPAVNTPKITEETIDTNNLNLETNFGNYSNLYFELREALETQKLYLNPELTLDDLIKVLGTNKKYLYYAIKSNTEDNFRSLVNEYRVNHVKSMIHDAIENTNKIDIDAIQHSSGFQSNASFFRIFKSKTGLTPSEYAKQVRLTLQSVA